MHGSWRRRWRVSPRCPDPCWCLATRQLQGILMELGPSEQPVGHVEGLGHRIFGQELAAGSRLVDLAHWDSVDVAGATPMPRA